MLDRNVAMAYAAHDGTGAGFVFEIPMGMVDRGADIGCVRARRLCRAMRLLCRGVH